MESTITSTWTKAEFAQQIAQYVREMNERGLYSHKIGFDADGDPAYSHDGRSLEGVLVEQPGDLDALACGEWVDGWTDDAVTGLAEAFRDQWIEQYNRSATDTGAPTIAFAAANA